MKIFAIGDLHLPGGQDKPMDVFGAGWVDHPVKIRRAWLEVVGEDDVVLVPGDLSWAMALDQAREDLQYLAGLPGRIVLIRGNHDYWWSAIGKVRRALPPNVCAIQNDHILLKGGWAICGTRGWKVPGAAGFVAEEDTKIYVREQHRLKLSLESALEAGAGRIIAMLHYPPTNERHEPSAFTRILESFPVVHCVYGHLHGAARRHGLVGRMGDVHYHLVSCDAVGFRPVLIETIDD
ncbi:MAG: metallophosphoesterase [Firmicutes bacterium]|nr:metallophosphoesterase [Bacillota bacterium]